MRTDGAEGRPKFLEITHEEEETLYERPMNLFFQIDGAMGRNVMPFPNNPFYNPEVKKWDALTVHERLDQIRDQLNSTEIACLESFFLLCSGGTAANTSFFDALRWWALCGYRSEGVTEYGLAYKLKCGTTAPHERILNEAMASGNMEIQLSTPISHISDSNGTVTLTTSANSTFTARKAVITIPLNVLHSITFSPPLLSPNASAISIGYSGLSSKIHAEVSSSGLRSWSGCSWPGIGLLYGYGDGTRNGGLKHTHRFFRCVGDPLSGEDDIEATKAAFTEMRDMNIKRIVSYLSHALLS